MLINIAAYFILLGLSGVSAYVLNDRLGYTPFLFLLAVGVFDITAVIVERFSIRIRPAGGDIALIKSSSSHLDYILDNRYIFFIPYARAYMKFSGDNIEKELNCECRFSLNPRSSSLVSMAVKPPHIGTFKAEISKIYIYGILGIIRIPIKKTVSRTVYVLPDLNKDVSFDFSASFADSHGLNGKNEDTGGTEFFIGAREYEPGDPINRIHWKLSAHMLKYMTRKSECAELARVTVIADLPIGSKRNGLLGVNDKIIELTLNEAKTCVKNGAGAVIVFRDGLRTVSVPAASEKGISAAAMRITTASPPIGNIADSEEALRGQCLLITADLDGTAAVKLTQSVNPAFKVSVVFINSNSEKVNEKLIKHFEKCGIKFMPVEM